MGTNAVCIWVWFTADRSSTVLCLIQLARKCSRLSAGRPQKMHFRCLFRRFRSPFPTLSEPTEPADRSNVPAIGRHFRRMQHWQLVAVTPAPRILQGRPGEHSNAWAAVCREVRTFLDRTHHRGITRNAGTTGARRTTSYSSSSRCTRTWAATPSHGRTSTASHCATAKPVSASPSSTHSRYYQRFCATPSAWRRWLTT